MFTRQKAAKLIEEINRRSNDFYCKAKDLLNAARSIDAATAEYDFCSKRFRDYSGKGCHISIVNYVARAEECAEHLRDMARWYEEKRAIEARKRQKLFAFIRSGKAPKIKFEVGASYVRNDNSVVKVIKRTDLTVTFENGDKRKRCKAREIFPGTEFCDTFDGLYIFADRRAE